MNNKLTPWFDDHSKPFHVGYYDTYWFDADKVRRRYWDGVVWRLEKGGMACGLQLHYWRGLAKKP